MIQIVTGDKAHHDVYGRVEVVGFTSVSDEIEINELERDGERYLDVVSSVQTDYVEFLDNEGREHQEPLEQFYNHADLEG